MQEQKENEMEEVPRLLGYSVAFYTHDWMRNLCGVIYENKNRKQYFCLHCETERKRERETETVVVWARVCLLSGQRQCEALRPLSSLTHSHTVIHSHSWLQLFMPCCVPSVLQRHRRRRRRPCGWRSTLCDAINNGKVLGQQMWHTDSAAASLFAHL